MKSKKNKPYPTEEVLLETYLLIDNPLNLGRDSPFAYIAAFLRTAKEVVKEFNVRTGEHATCVNDIRDYIARHEECKLRLLTLERPIPREWQMHSEDTCPKCGGHKVAWANPVVENYRVYIPGTCQSCHTIWCATGKLTGAIPFDPNALKKADITV